MNIENTNVEIKPERLLMTVTAQPLAQNYKRQEWSVGMCDWWQQCDQCFYAALCPTCYLASLFSRTNEGCLSFLWVPLSQLRTKVRIERGIQGSLCSDVCATFFCPFCVMVQMGVEIRETQPLI